MKKLKKILFVSLSVVSLVAFFCAPAAAMSVNTEVPSSLTVLYRAGEQGVENLEVKAYRVASVSQDGEYTLCGDFQNYPLSLSDVKSRSEWQAVASTLEGYIAADKISTQLTGKTDESGAIKFQGLLTGMYLVLQTSSAVDGEIVVFETFLTAIPMTNEDGSCTYDVTAIPKHENHKPTPDKKTEYSVIKQWKDSAHSASRPKSVKVDILKNGELYATKLLSAENNWSFKWQALDDGSVWTAVERDAPKDYYVSVEKSGNCFIITNVKSEKLTEIPKTGDTAVFWPYFIAMCISGIVLICFGIWKKRTAQ